MLGWLKGRKEGPREVLPSRERLLSELQAPDMESRGVALKTAVRAYFGAVPNLGEELTEAVLRMMCSDSDIELRIAAIRAACEDLRWFYDSPGGPLNVRLARGVREHVVAIVTGLPEDDRSARWAGRLVSQFGASADHTALSPRVTCQRAYLEGIDEGIVGKSAWHDDRVELVEVLAQSGEPVFEQAARELYEILADGGCMCC